MTDVRKLLSNKNIPRFTWGIMLTLTVTALALNMGVSWKAFFSEPLREAASRPLMAVSSSFFYASGMTEPVPVAALKGFMLSGFSPDTLLRLQGLLLLPVTVAVTLLVLWKRFGAFSALLAALFLAANPYMGYYSMQASSHLFALPFLLLFWHYFDSPGGGRKEFLLSGLFGGLACLSRLDAAWAVLIIAALTWAVRGRKLPLKETGLSLGLAFLLLAPYLAYQKAEYGNAFYAQELSLRRWANIDRYAYEPGHSRPQGPLGISGFLFRDGAASALGRPFRGLGRALTSEVPKTLHYKFMMVLVFLGVYAAFVRKKERLLFFLAAALLPVLPLASIKQVPATGGIELRYYLWTLWALCALGGIGFQETMDWAESAVVKWGKARFGPAAKK